MAKIVNKEEAEALAIDAFTFIAQDPELLPRFLSLSGICATDIRQASTAPGFWAGVLNFLLAHEPTLLQFSQMSGYAPELVAKAFSLLPGGGIIER